MVGNWYSGVVCSCLSSQNNRRKMINFILCSIGWKMYDDYLARKITWRKYIQHRRMCETCTKPKKGKKWTLTKNQNHRKKKNHQSDQNQTWHLFGKAYCTKIVFRGKMNAVSGLDWGRTKSRPTNPLQLNSLCIFWITQSRDNTDKPLGDV